MCIRDSISGVPDRVQVGAHSQIRGRLLVFPHTGRIRIGDWTYIGAVSYTHLRAHETVLDLVCRLLLEKKKSTHIDN